MQTPPAGSAHLAPTRARDRIHRETERIHAVLDEARICHVGVVVDGWPHVLPTLHVRRGDTLYIHGSAGARVLAAGRAGHLPICVTVSLLDGLVLARSAVRHSVNYRSVLIRGLASAVLDEDDKRAVLATFVDRTAPGRSGACRPANRRELAATAVLAVALDDPATQVTLKARTGGPVDDPEDLALPHWAGVIPVRTVEGPPEPAEDLADPSAPIGS
ncbi:pyridoxamine 5'-phosphate oxidase family protein [Frankia gtarii]|uniref:pyridoxamine 5'-phosphate oxidase family protein n=1 Tax=Frankia gtarii TaxID=2950102 RepID=UPI0021BE6C36|nr:pyridoxamine 5'-phosphate oxidase family protein [Frankia gtarii]